MKKLLLLIPALVLWAGSAAAAGPGVEVRALIEPLVRTGRIPGVVAMVADRDGVVWSEAIGYADLEAGRPMTTGTLFWIASQSKPIAGAALMMLVEEGKVDLDVPVSTYLPELEGLSVLRVDRDGVRVLEKPATAPTLRMLMSHTGGMRWIAAVQQGMHKIDVIPMGISTHVSALTPLICEPGTAYNYSNQGINVGAAVVERISGMPYEQFLQQRLFDPLGMTSATFWPTVEQQRDIAVPYMLVDGKLVPTTVDQLQYPIEDRAKRYSEAAGGLFCTPDDLVKFYRMIAGKGTFEGQRFLSEESVEALGTKQTGDNIADPYGIGWVATDWFMGHSGAYGTDTKIYKKNGLVVMYFIQAADLPAHGYTFAAFEDIVRTAYDMHP